MASNRNPALAWAYAVIVVAVWLAHGSFKSRGVLGDDLCMCELAASRGYLDAVQFWLRTVNSRLFLAVTQVGTYQLPWFASPLVAPWWVLHGIVVLAHAANGILLFGLLSRAGVAAGPSLAATLVLAIHPVTAESVLWLAAAYGYVFGLLLALLAVWTYLEYERGGRRRWLFATVVLALAATLGIEQFLPALGALAVVRLLHARRHPAARPAWAALAIVACCALVFALVHFVLFPGTGGRLAQAAAKVDPVARPGMLWHLAWWLSLVPEHSPWAPAFGSGLQEARHSGWLAAGIVAVSLLALWRTAAAGAWPGPLGQDATGPKPTLWLVAAGALSSLASLLPFAFTGYIGLSQRNAYVLLPGVLVAGAAVVGAAAVRPAPRRGLRATLAVLVAIGVATSLVIGTGKQAGYARDWQVNRHVIAALDAHSQRIRDAGGVALIIVPSWQGHTHLPVHPWIFPCLVRWIVADGSVKSWIGSAEPEGGPPVPAGSHRITLRSH